jgi:hypothetical protein
MKNTLSPEQFSCLRTLVRSLHYAQDLAEDVWQYAVEIDSLRVMGLGSSDIRWLVSKGYIAHALEVTKPHDKQRQFQAADNLALTERSCFVVTCSGIDLLAQWGGRTETFEPTFAKPPMNDRDEDLPRRRPRWDEKQHTLYWGSVLVKHFQREARNQEAILRSFEEAAWAEVLSEVPILRTTGNTKACFRDAIRNLNRNVAPYLSFRQEGCGRRLVWQARATDRHATQL